MKISLSWLRDYVETDLKAEEIAEILSNLGLPCEGIEHLADDVVIDVEVTSNRGDCLSHIGIARELAAATGKALRLPDVRLEETNPPASDLVQVEIREQYDEVPLVLFHDELIEWVVENLIKNALDAIDKEQGVISISLSYNATERTVDLHVRDNGRGMTPAQRRKIFRPGFTTKTRGWGLGLTLSRRIIEEYHDAHLILLDSHEGHGSCFLIRFPV